MNPDMCILNSLQKDDISAQTGHWRLLFWNHCWLQETVVYILLYPGKVCALVVKEGVMLFVHDTLMLTKLEGEDTSVEKA